MILMMNTVFKKSKVVLFGKLIKFTLSKSPYFIFAKLYEYIRFLHAGHICNIGAEYLTCSLLNLRITLSSADQVQ